MKQCSANDDLIIDPTKNARRREAFRSHERPVLAAEVFDGDVVVVDEKAGVLPRDVERINDDGRRGIATDDRFARLQVNGLVADPQNEG
jgi:hypothetical protein